MTSICPCQTVTASLERDLSAIYWITIPALKISVTISRRNQKKSMAASAAQATLQRSEGIEETDYRSLHQCTVTSGGGEERLFSEAERRGFVGWYTRSGITVEY